MSSCRDVSDRMGVPGCRIVPARGCRPRGGDVAATPGEPGRSRRTSQSTWDPLGGADLRLRRRVRTKTQVQAEALALFAEKGYSQTSVEDIADATAQPQVSAAQRV